MQPFSKIIAVLLLVSNCMISCTKGTLNGDQFYYGNVEVSLAPLPYTPNMVLYVDNDSIGPLQTILNPILYRGGTSEKKQISIYIEGTKELVADTLLQLVSGQVIHLKAAYSEPLGMSGFLSGSTTVDPDSSRFQLFNGLPAALLPEGVEVDAILYYDNDAGQTVEAGIVWENFERGKLHPLMVTVKARNYYLVKFRNRATGEFLADSFGFDAAQLAVEPGKYHILSATSWEFSGMYGFLIDAAQL